MWPWSKPKNPNERRILITGGGGCGGANFANFELNYDNSVYIVDLFNTPNTLLSVNFLKRNPNSRKLKVIKGDICNRQFIYKLLNKYKIDWVVHFAMEDGAFNSVKSPGNYIHTNVIGTYEVLRASSMYYDNLYGERKDRFRLHHISTDEIFGDLPIDTTELFNEQSLYNPSSPFASTKAAADLISKAWYKTYHLPLTISYSGNLFGPLQNHDRLVAKTIVTLVNQEQMPIYNQGKDLRNWVYVGDHSEAVHNIITKGKMGESYCISSNDNLTNQDVVQRICNILSREYNNQIDYTSFIQYTENFRGEDQRHQMDNYRLRNELGYELGTPFDEAMLKTVRWYLKYYNIKACKGKK